MAKQVLAKCLSVADMIKPIKIAIIGVYLAALCSCQGLPGAATRQTRVLPQDLVQSVSARPYARAYYYFALAQLNLKQGDVNEALWCMDEAIKADSQSAYLKIEMANLLMIKKDYDKALAMIKQVLEQQPDNIQGLTLAGRIYQRKQDMTSAKAAFEKALALNPTDPGIYLLLGRIYWNENDLENAGRIFGQMVKQLPDSYVAQYFNGKVLLGQGKQDLAEAAFLRALEIDPTLQEPRNELLKIYQNQNRKEKITQTYRAILEYNPDNYKAVLGLSLHYRSMGRQAQAKALLKDLGRRSESDGSIISAVYESYLEPKKYETAAWILENMLPGSPHSSDLHYLAGVAYEGLARNQAALKHLLQVRHDSRFYNNAVVNSAFLYHDLGKIDRAIAVIQKALTYSPHNADYFLYLGSFYDELERYEEALSALRQGLAIDDQNSRLYFRLGVVYDKMGRKQDSIAAMKTVVKLKPDNAEALNYLGYTYADLGINLDEAESLIQSALQFKPEDGYICDSLGWVYFKRGQYSDALKWLNKAAQLVPEDPVIMEHLGDVYLKLKSKDKAVQYYRRSLKKSPKDKQAIEAKIRALRTQ